MDVMTSQRPSSLAPLDRPASPASPDAPPARQDAPADPPPTFNVSMTAVVAGAFAAVTSALVGSRLGTTGTLIGAALGSMIGALATALYTWSIQRTVHVLKAVTPRTRGRASGDHAALEPAGHDLTSSSPALAAQDASADGPTPERSGLSVRARWILAGIAAAALAFVVSLVVITGFEKATGSSLSGGQGTTIQQAARPADTAPADQQDRPAAPQPTLTPAGDVSATPEPTTAAPSATPEPTDTGDGATATPQPSSGPTTSPQPTSAPEPTTVATEQAAVGSPAPQPSAPQTPRG